MYSTGAQQPKTFLRHHLLKPNHVHLVLAARFCNDWSAAGIAACSQALRANCFTAVMSNLTQPCSVAAAALLDVENYVTEFY